MKHTILLDADFIVYKIGFACEHSVDFDDDWVLPVGDKREADSRLQAEFADIHKRFGNVEVICCLSDLSSNFRKDVLPTYKSNRGQGRSRPVLFDYIRAGFGQRHRVECWDSLEADDVMGILSTRMGAATTILSIDKDMKTIPGRLVSPTGDWELQEITEEQAYRWFLTQTLTGDSVDCYKGCPGIGPKKAEKVLQDGTWEEVVGAYEKAGLTEKDALVQARVARILRDEDYINGEVKLWEPN